MMERINLTEELALFADHWQPQVIGELNSEHVKLASCRHLRLAPSRAGDELFLVLHGTLVMRLRDGEITLAEGEMCIVPRGVEHQPHAKEEVQVLLFESASTVNTGNVRNARTKFRLEHL